MRFLDSKKIAYKHYQYDPETTDGLEVAKAVSQPREKVFKTLVTVGSTNNHYVFVIPVGETLDLKKAAKSVGEKSVVMIKQKDLLPLTGYVHGGCSPIGMKKQFKTVFHSTMQSQDTVCVSAGQKGNQIEIAVEELTRLVVGRFEELIV